MHEATHVWQYQTQGTAYISDSVAAQTFDKDAYEVSIVPGRRFLDYTAEQQAELVRSYYMDWPAGRASNSDMLRMIDEIRKERPGHLPKGSAAWKGPQDGPSAPPNLRNPVLQSVQKAQEDARQRNQINRWVGLGAEVISPFCSPDQKKPATTIPLIRIDFNFLTPGVKK